MKRIHRLLYPADRSRSAGIAPWLSVPVVFTLVVCAAPAWQQMTRFDRWLNEEAVYIIPPTERNSFLALRSDEERQQFINQFWARRDPDPATPENEMKEEHDRRIAYANAQYSSPAIAGWKSDRGQMYIIYGPPDEIESHPSGASQLAYPFERWRYRFMEGRGPNYIATFADVTRNGEYRRQGEEVPRLQSPIIEPTARFSRADGTMNLAIPLQTDIARHEVVIIAGNRSLTHQVTLCKYEQVAGSQDTPVYAVTVELTSENSV